MSSPKLQLLLILALGFSLRLGFLLAERPWSFPVTKQLEVQNDAPLYHRLACNLLDGHGFAADGTGAPSSLHVAQLPGKPDELRTPVYPLFVAGIYAVAGRQPWAVYVIQIVLDTLSCFLLFRALFPIMGVRAASTASLFYALDPFLILYASALLTDVLFVFWLVLGLWLFVNVVLSRPPTHLPWKFSALGGVVGVMTLTRPVSQYLPVVLAVMILVYLRRRRWVSLVSAGALVAAFLIVISPWLTRNYRTFGAARLTYIGSWDLLCLDVGLVETSRRGESLEATQASLLDEANKLAQADGKEPASLSLLQQSPYWEKLAVRYIRHEPLQFAEEHLKGAFFMFANLGTSDYARALRQPTFSMESQRGIASNAVRTFMNRKTRLEIVTAGFVSCILLVTYVGAIIGLVVGWKTSRHRPDVRAWWWLTVMTILYFVGVVGPIGLARLKLPMVPLYLGLAGLGWIYVLKRPKEEVEA